MEIPLVGPLQTFFSHSHKIEGIPLQRYRRLHFGRRLQHPPKPASPGPFFLYILDFIVYANLHFPWDADQNKGNCRRIQNCVIQ
jgi:hypothetical protein